jgi:hypothetical protein
MAIHNNIAQDLLPMTYNAVRALTKLLREPSGSGMAELNNSDGCRPRNQNVFPFSNADSLQPSELTIFHI